MAIKGVGTDLVSARAFTRGQLTGIVWRQARSITSSRAQRGDLLFHQLTELEYLRRAKLEAPHNL